MKKSILALFMMTFLVACGGSGGGTQEATPEVTETTPPLTLIIPEKRVLIDQNNEVELRMRFIGASRAESFCIKIPESWIQNENPNNEANDEKNVCHPFEIAQNGKKIYDKSDKGILNVRAYYKEGEIVLIMKVDLVRRTGRFEENLIVVFKEKDTSFSQRLFRFQSDWVLPILIEVHRNDPRPVEGCTNSAASNYNPDADEDNGTCVYPDPEPNIPSSNPVVAPDPILGCTDDIAENYNPDATEDDGSCTYQCEGTDFCDEEPDPELCWDNSEPPCTPEPPVIPVGNLIGVASGLCTVYQSNGSNNDVDVSIGLEIESFNPLILGSFQGDGTNFIIAASFVGNWMSQSGPPDFDIYEESPRVPDDIIVKFWIKGEITGSETLTGTGTWAYVKEIISTEQTLVACSGTWSSN